MKSKSGTKAVVAKPEKKEKVAKKAPKAEAKAVAEETKVIAKGPLAKEGAGDAHAVLVAPIFTEKSGALQAQNKYAFIVARHAGKVEIARAIRDLYGVKPVAVHVLVLKGKQVRFGRYSGKEKDVKKAIVTLKKGDAIAVME
ncbi:MAG TPA: 50S ribosomal protein L23 [Usitatibacter sp.]